MSYDFNGTNQHISAASTPASGPPATIAAWFNPDNVTGTKTIASIGGSNNYDRLYLHLSAATLRAQQYTFGGSFNEASATASASVSTWSHAAGVFTSNSSRTVYLDGGNSATNTGTSVASTLSTRTNIGVYFNSTAGNYFDGRIAEVGVWNVALTADEIASLAKGFSPALIRPQSLTYYAPLVRELTEIRGGLTLTNNNTATVADHPRVYF